MSRLRGVDPTASRTPNSRVRALTENASTPATPTTAISSAIPAKPDTTKAFSRSGVRTSARTSSSVAGRSTAWFADRSRMIRVTLGTSAYGSPAVRTNMRIGRLLPRYGAVERHGRRTLPTRSSSTSATTPTMRDGVGLGGPTGSARR